MAIFEAMAEMATIATSCPSPRLDSASQRQFVSLAKNIDSPSRHTDPLVSVSHLPVWLSLT